MSFVPPSSRPFSRTDRPKAFEWVRIQTGAVPSKSASKAKGLWLPGILIGFCLLALFALAYKMFGGSSKSTEAISPGSKSSKHRGPSTDNNKPDQGVQPKIQYRPLPAGPGIVTYQFNLGLQPHEELDPRRPLDIHGLTASPTVTLDNLNNGAWRVRVSFNAAGKRSGSFSVTGVRYLSGNEESFDAPISIDWTLDAPAKDARIKHAGRAVTLY
jgi:hypothetical protein